MNYKTHRIGGLCAGFIATNILFPGTFTVTKLVLGSAFLAGSYIGSVVPDIDHPNSFIGKRFKVISYGVNKMCGHRGFVHSPLFFLIYSLLVMFLSVYFSGFAQILYYQFAMGSVLGFFSHLLLDCLTVGGIPLLSPFSKKTYRIAKFRTNKSEGIVSFLCILITIGITLLGSL